MVSKFEDLDDTYILVRLSNGETVYGATVSNKSLIEDFEIDPPDAGIILFQPLTFEKVKNPNDPDKFVLIPHNYIDGVVNTLIEISYDHIVTIDYLDDELMELYTTAGNYLDIKDREYDKFLVESKNYLQSEIVRMRKLTHLEVLEEFDEEEATVN